MASKALNMSDSMHYETRSIRDALAASNARLRSARYSRPKDLQPQQGAGMMQEWEGLSQPGDLDTDNTPASSNPHFAAMRSALLAFEREVAYAAPARERAFFSALRSQLMEAAQQREAEARDMQLAAVFKWFARHKPQGPEADPVTAAVLASSLSVEAVAAADSRAPPGGLPPRLGGSQPAGSSGLNPYSALGASTSGSGGGAGPQGKHQFFSVFSKAPGAATGSGAATGVPAALRPLSGRAPSPGMQRAAAAAAGPGSLSVQHPLVMHPSVASTSPPRVSASMVAASAAAAVPAAAPSQLRARFAPKSADMFAPGKLVRPQELDELDHRAAQAAAAAAVAGSGLQERALHTKPWIPGPHRTPVGTGGPFPGGPGRGGAGRREAGEEDEEIRALREKWSAMDARTSQSVADVQAKVAEWTLQRARLEEEIVRRQEANRFAPTAGGAAHSTWQPAGRQADTEDGSLPPGHLSPYANANADLAAATAAATSTGLPSSGAATGVSFLLAGGSAPTAAAYSGASMRQRHADVALYDSERADLVVRLAQLGVAVGGDTLDRALRPMEDRPFLEAISKLPKPGEHLASRPGSVRLPAAKKKRSKSAARKRPTSGR